MPKYWKKSDNEDMKKGDRPDPGEEFLYRLSSNREFQRDLLEARQFLDMPKNGFNSENEQKKWAKNHDILDLLSVEMSFQKKYKISIAHLFYIDDYIFFGKARDKKEEKEKKLPPPVVIDRYTHRADMDTGDIEQFYKEIGEPYAKLFILGNTSKSDVLDYINKNWETISAIFAEQGSYKKVIRKTIQKERNQRIIELWRKPIAELRREADKTNPSNAPHQSKYKDLLIRVILKDKFGEINEGYIRKIGSTK